MNKYFGEQHLFEMDKISIIHCKCHIKPFLPNEPSLSSRREKLLGDWFGGGLIWKLDDSEDVLEEEG